MSARDFNICMVARKGVFTYMTASLEDPDLLLHVVFADRQLVATVRADNFLIFGRAAGEAFLGRRWGLLGTNRTGLVAFFS